MTPDLDPNSDAKILQIFLQPYFANPTKLTLPGVLPPSVIPFWKPLMTLDLDPNSDANSKLKTQKSKLQTSNS